MRTPKILASEKPCLHQMARSYVLVWLSATFCLTTTGPVTVLAQNIERLPETTTLSAQAERANPLVVIRSDGLPSKIKDPRFSPVAYTQVSDSPTEAPQLQPPQNNAPEEAPGNFPPAVLGPSTPVGHQIKIIRIPDLYGQCPGVAQDQLLNLCEAISYSASNNPSIRQAQADIDNARAGKKVAFAPFLPSVNAQDQLYKSSNPFTSLIYGGSPLSRNQELNIAQVNAEWIIWDFGRTLGTYRQSDIILKIAQLRYAKACQTIGYDTADAYFQVLIGKASVRVADDSIKRAEEYLRVAKNMYDAGKIDSEGVLSAQLELVNSQQLMVDAIARRQVAVAGLNNVLGINLMDKACVQDVNSQPDFFPPIEDCIQTGLAKRPEMCVAKNEIAFVVQECKIAKAQFKPTATANGNYTNVTGTFETDLWEGNVQFEWDLFTGGARAGQMREAQATMARAKAHAQKISDNIVYEIKQSYEQLRAARHQLTLSRAAITVAREKQRIVLNKFQVGKASPTDVVDAQTQLTSAEQDYYTAIYKLHIAIADLNYQMGNIDCCPTDGA